MNPPSPTLLREILVAAIREDVGCGDITSGATVPTEARATGRYTAKQALVVSGVSVAREVVSLVDPELEFAVARQDGESVRPGTVLAEVRGRARSILAAERTSLNLLQRMSGIATTTRRYVERVAGTRARIVDTRKTVPGLRVLDKYAVTCGGGMNHRMGLFDGVLVKSNHLVFHRSAADAIQEVRRQLGHLMKIEVEVGKLDELRSALTGHADVILLDNFTPEEARAAVELVSGRVPLESSGGVSLENVRLFAEAGVDYISVGCLTHSVVAADLHLRLTPE